MSGSDFAPQEIKKQQPPHIFYFRGGTELTDIYPPLLRLPGKTKTTPANQHLILKYIVKYTIITYI